MAVPPSSSWRIFSGWPNSNAESSWDGWPLVPDYRRPASRRHSACNPARPSLKNITS